jgi:uncharacterized protein YqgQ
MSLLNQEDRWTLDHIESEVIRAESDMAIMEYALEEVYTERLQTDWEYYKGAPTMLMHCHVAVLQELYNMEMEFCDREEYEKCAVIVKVCNTLVKKFDIRAKLNPAS